MTGPQRLKYSSPRRELADFVPQAARRILDVGCADGGFGLTMRDAGTSAELWGLEPDLDAAGRASDVYDVVVTDVFPSARLPERHFDAIFFNDVLEHLVDPWSALGAAKPLLSERGVVIASIPNSRHVDVWWPLLRHGAWSYTETGLLDRTHLRFFTRSSIREMFETGGWSVLSLDGINRTRRSPYGQDGWKTRWLGRLSRGKTDDLFFVQFVVVARPSGVN